MFVSFRAAILVLASLAAASVAPAQVGSGQVFATASVSKTAEPLIATNELPRIVTPALIENSFSSVTDDDLRPAASAPPTSAKNDGLAEPIPGESLAAMVARLRTSAAPTRERECLATAIYFEAKSEPLAGQLAVGEVLANRVKSGRFASSYCGVVMQRGQFSFVHGTSLPSVPRAGLQWKNAMAIATIVDSKLQSSAAPRALFFHAKRVAPGWHLTRVASIGNHIFYR